MSSLETSPSKNGSRKDKNGAGDAACSKDVDGCLKDEQGSQTSLENIKDDVQKEDDGSDCEEYVPSASDDSSANSDDADDDSSGSEEQGVTVVSKAYGGSKFYKLKFADIEEKRKQYLSKIEALEKEEASSPDEKHGCSSSEPDPMSDQISKASFSNYRSLLLNLGEGDAMSDDDDDFDPIYCGETLSDEEEEIDEDEKTESEPEIESLQQKHRKTGETLKCIKMMENYLAIPADFDSKEEDSSGSGPMEH